MFDNQPFLAAGAVYVMKILLLEISGRLYYKIVYAFPEKNTFLQTCALNITRFMKKLRLGAGHSKPMQTLTTALMKTRMATLRENLEGVGVAREGLRKY